MRGRADLKWAEPQRGETTSPNPCTGRDQLAPTRVLSPNPGPKYFPSCLHGRRNSGSASFTGRGRVDDGAPPLVEETARSGSSRYARPGGQGSATGIGTGLGHWDGSGKAPSPQPSPIRSGPKRTGEGERAGRDTGWDGTSISSHCYFVPQLFHHTGATDNVPGGEKIPGGTCRGRRIDLLVVGILFQ